MGKLREDPQHRLFPSGIQTEGSDIRCHVAPGTRKIFVFPTKSFFDLDLTKYEKRYAGQPGVDYATAEGYRVPPEDIPELRTIRWYSEPWWEAFDKNHSTSKKGRCAVEVVKRLLRTGRFPLWLADPEESDSASLQRKGTDLLLFARWKIQVKCDYDAGRDDNGNGKGGLFLQTAERNPHKRY